MTLLFSSVKIISKFVPIPEQVNVEVNGISPEAISTSKDSQMLHPSSSSVQSSVHHTHQSHSSHASYCGIPSPHRSSYVLHTGLKSAFFLHCHVHTCKSASYENQTTSWSKGHNHAASTTGSSQSHALSKSYIVHQFFSPHTACHFGVPSSISCFTATRITTTIAIFSISIITFFSSI